MTSSQVPISLTQTSAREDFSGCPGSNSYVGILRPEGTDTVRYDSFVALLFKQQSLTLMTLHAALGVAGEAGELADAIKKEIIYGKPTDRANIVEELGDLRFYVQAVQQLYGISEQEVLQQNANKLCVRYKSLRYSDGDAIGRADKSGQSGAPEA
jgi:NTP pyrophosphatase (non-canonical NTP hydrolase)